jgi:TRAP-type C4-dicarboxylate transport system substrate-binding protein
MKKHLLLILFTIILASSLILVGCKTQEPTTTEPTTPKPTTSTPADSTEVITLKFSEPSPLPPEGVFDYQTAIINWCQRVEDETNGRVHIEIYPAESLLTYEDTYRGVATGVADIGSWSPHYDAANFSLTSGFALPGIPWGSYESIYKVHRDTFAAVPALQAEFKDVKIVGYAAQDEGIMFFNGKEVRTPADLNGLKIAASAAEIPRAEALGGVGVSITAADRYLALERGTVDGGIMVWGAVRAFRLYEVCDWFCEHIAQPRNNSYTIMNQQVFDNLPPDVQEVIENLIPWYSQELLRGYKEAGLGGRDLTVEAGHTIYAPTPEELELWVEALAPLQEEWVQQQEAKGKPGRELLDELLRIAQENYDG